MQSIVSWQFVGVTDVVADALLKLLQANDPQAGLLVQQRYEQLVPGTETTIIKDRSTDSYFGVPSSGNAIPAAKVIQTWFDGLAAPQSESFKASIVSAVRNLSAENNLDIGTSLDVSNINLLQITPGVHLFLLLFVSFVLACQRLFHCSHMFGLLNAFCSFQANPPIFVASTLA